MLRIVYRNKPRKLRGAMGFDELGHGYGPKGRIEKLRQILTALIRHERLEGTYSFLDETRGYAELVNICLCHAHYCKDRNLLPVTIT